MVIQYGTEFKEMGINIRRPSQTDRTPQMGVPNLFNNGTNFPKSDALTNLVVMNPQGSISMVLFFFLFHKTQAGNAKVATISPVFYAVLNKKIFRALCHTSSKVQVT